MPTKVVSPQNKVNALTFEKDDYENLTRCPWCESPKHVKWGGEVRGFHTVCCKSCGLIYIKNRLNDQGLDKYYSNYLTHVHQADETLNRQRTQMYKLEFDLIVRYLKKGAKVLDVGCSGGYFLDMFKEKGYRCYGVELGDEAAREAAKNHRIWHGKFPDLAIDKKFDLIIFRGVIEHVAYPKTYLKKAVSLLKKEGLIYITSTPNADALCCRLFKEQWNMHVPEPHLMHFKTKHFDEYFTRKGFAKVEEHFFYEGTPYADPEEDVRKVAEAIRFKKAHKKIGFRGPAFWGNMMTLVYRGDDHL